MANKRRGEISFVAGEETYTMCMSLGAMAEIEDAFDLESIAELSTIFSDGKFKISDLIKLLGALIRGGGHDITDKEIGTFDLDAVEAFGKAMEAINSQGGEEEKPKKKPKIRKKRK